MKVLLIDGHYYAYRSHFAIRELRNHLGQPTNAIYGFVKTVRRMLKDLAPDRAAVIWDGGLPKRRTELQPDYKQQRAEMPADLSAQLPVIQRLTPLLGLASLWLEETEADDLMASYTTAARAQGAEVVLATNDKDLFQLVDDRVHVYSTNKTDLASPKDTFALLGAETVVKKWGVPPGQIGEVLSLIGDTVDNIRGVDGIGPKGAAALLKTHGSLDALLANLDAVANERLREKLKAARTQIEQNREMVRLDLDLALPTPLEGLALSPDFARLIPELEQCGFKSLLAEVKAESALLSAALSPPPPPSVPAASAAQGELF